ncbi:phosphopyruvate hydratase [Halogeometricum borinquense]|uniref:Enolase n=2 Tax=Halogeometricum borinquense TaxID=60847 RepID=E4NRP9_HALBP|nr:phosphopyruvate hydratase [Halogeometricum borinquense]ADQ66836.1 enolase [Halogeometricum borinquense DSM 11551]ELY30344.1 enolase [Halogeometricum borinquense DSM 11551]QIB74850.1 phosphopyruvate hydratase [Halogeometricum borinquense]QIQ76152.1 phosphopyruvate hydratase [Halogeometricum borinquense]RYJ14128.1 phosphopyruvate hydratase [Halogeometricum borinquense]
MTLITDVRLRRVLDSRGNPTVEADVLTQSGGFGRAAAPSGASTGEYEAIELPPSEAIAAARRHAVPRLIEEVHAGNQREVDGALRAADGTDNFSEIGANSAVAISMAAAKAGADVLGAPLYQHLGGAFRGENFPVPLGNVVGGGEHAKEATHIQEFLAAPVGAPSVSEAVFANAAVHARVSEILDERDTPAAKGDEGAWAPPISDAEAFEVVDEAVSDVEDELGFEVRFGLDMAAAELYDDDEDGYVYGDEVKSTDEQVDYVAEMVEEYDLVYVEDPLDEDDYEGFADLTERVGDQTLICGDDLFVTNVERLQDGIDAGAGNSILIKPNQIGTLSDAFDAVELAVRNGYDAVISHRSGETEDTTIAHLAVATDAAFIKTGTVQGERTAKLNELIRIADDAV